MLYDLMNDDSDQLPAEHARVRAMTTEIIILRFMLHVNFRVHELVYKLMPGTLKLYENQ